MESLIVRAIVAVFTVNPGSFIRVFSVGSQRSKGAATPPSETPGLTQLSVVAPPGRSTDVGVEPTLGSPQGWSSSLQERIMT